MNFLNLHRIIDMAYQRDKFIDCFDDAMKPAIVHMCLIAYANANNKSRQLIPHWTEEIEALVYKFAADELKGNNKVVTRKKALLCALDQGDHLKIKQLYGRAREQFKKEGFPCSQTFFEGIQAPLSKAVEELVNIIATQDFDEFDSWIEKISNLA